LAATGAANERARAAAKAGRSRCFMRGSSSADSSLRHHPAGVRSISLSYN
jgi:hypothetical protein